MKKVLIIAYFYPPIGEIGVLKTLKLTKYLPDFGWEPHVITVKNRDRFYTEEGNEKIPPRVHVYRARNILNNLSIIPGGLRRLGINSSIIVPDIYIGWIPHTIYLGKKIIEKEKIDVIYVSCSPFSSALSGVMLKKITGTPLLIDFRDSWTLNPYAKYFSNTINKVDRLLEEWVVKNCDFLIGTTEGITKDYVEKYPHLESKIKTITNGFDIEDIIPNDTTNDTNLFEKFTIVYVGSFYGNRTPETLFKALKNIINRNLIPNNEIQFLWAGKKNSEIDSMIKTYEIEKIVNYVGYVSQKESIELTYKSHLLFFVIGFTDDAKNNTLTGKIFQYLASGRPILALIPEGSAKDLIRRYSTNSYIINSNDSNMVLNSVMDAYNKWKNGDLIKTPEEIVNDFLNEYNTKNMTKKLTKLLQKAID